MASLSRLRSCLVVGIAVGLYRHYKAGLHWHHRKGLLSTNTLRDAKSKARSKSYDPGGEPASFEVPSRSRCARHGATDQGKEGERGGLNGLCGPTSVKYESRMCTFTSSAPSTSELGVFTRYLFITASWNASSRSANNPRPLALRQLKREPNPRHIFGTRTKRSLEEPTGGGKNK